MKKLTDKLYVSVQIRPDDFEAISAAGIKTIINNRPDGEAPDQPQGSDIRGAAENLEMDYHGIPISGGFSLEQVEAFRGILDGAEAPVLAFCKSGTRSTILWALSQAGTLSTDEIIETAGKAGYDLTRYASMIENAAG